MIEPFIELLRLETESLKTERAKASLTYGNITINLIKKPNILFRLFLRILGIKVEVKK